MPANLGRPLGHSARFTDPLFAKVPATYAPWWRYTEFVLPTGAAIGTTWEMLDPANRVPAIRNDQKWPVFVQEVRWQLYPTVISNIRTADFGAKVHSDLQGAITGRHVLLGAFMTDDRAFLYNTGTPFAVVRLPERYQQSHKGTFVIKLMPQSADCAGRQLDICLRGYDPINKTPIVLNKRHTTGAPNQETTVTFDDDRDGSVRDMWIEDIAFGCVTMYYNVAAAGTDPFDDLMVRFEPNAGPRWTSNPWTPISMLSEHLCGDLATLTVEHWAIHRPMAPYPLNAGHALRVNMMNYAVPGQNVRVRMIGRGVQGVQDAAAQVR